MTFRGNDQEIQEAAKKVRILQDAIRHWEGNPLKQLELERDLFAASNILAYLCSTKD